MYIFLIIVHVFVCFVLIFVVLLQAGRGGGLSEMIAGGQPQTLFGTQTNAFMVRATEVCAVLFLVTSLSLGILSTQRGKSVMEKRRLADVLKTAVPAAATPPAVQQAAPVPAPAQNAPVPASQPAAETQQSQPAVPTAETQTPSKS